MYIYKITNLINDKIYVGQSSKNSEDNPWYFGSGKLIGLAIKKYGRENFSKEVIREVSTSKNLEKFKLMGKKNKGRARPDVTLNNLERSKTGIGFQLGENPSKNLLTHSTAKGKINHPWKNKQFNNGWEINLIGRCVDG